jgi:hypothetical protein
VTADGFSTGAWVLIAGGKICFEVLLGGGVGSLKSAK